MNEPAPKRRWVRFGATWLTAIVAIGVCLAIASYWHGRYQAAQAAQQTYARILAEWEAENVTTEELCNSSLTWLVAELRIPLVSSNRAIDSHVARVMAAVKQIDALFATTWAEGGEEAAKAEVARIRRVYIDAIERARQSP